MLSVRDVANFYEVSPAFVVGGFRKIGVDVSGPEDLVMNSQVDKFEAEWGDKIRAKNPAAPRRPKLASVPMADRRSPREPAQHVIRVAFSHVTGQKVNGTVHTVMAPETMRGRAHAIDPVGTNDGDPWAGDLSPHDGAHSFYSHPGPYAACGARVRVVMGEAFTADRPDVCMACVRIYANGKAYRNPPGTYRREPRYCEAYIRVKNAEGVVRLEDCHLRSYHEGRHKSDSGATWKSGADDYEPPPRIEND
jgi:hypothetical protein